MPHPTRAYLLTTHTTTLTPSHKPATFDPVYHSHPTWPTRFPTHRKFLYKDSVTGVALPFHIYVADAGVDGVWGSGEWGVYYFGAGEG